MTTREVPVRRIAVTSKKSFDAVVGAVQAAISHPNMFDFVRRIAESNSYSEMQKVVHEAVGKTGLMEFTRFDLGMVMTKAVGPGAPKSLRLVAGNPLIMQAMVRHVPDAASYAPVTILIDERADGVHLSYDEYGQLFGAIWERRGFAGRARSGCKD